MIGGCLLCFICGDVDSPRGVGGKERGGRKGGEGGWRVGDEGWR